MSSKPAGLDILRNELAGCRPLHWSYNKHPKNKDLLPHLLTYLELTEMLKDPSVTRVNKRVTKCLLKHEVKQFLSFTLEGTGLLVYSFVNGYPTRFWLIPEICLTRPVMMKAINKSNKLLEEYSSHVTMGTQMDWLKTVAEEVYRNDTTPVIKSTRGAS